MVTGGLASEGCTGTSTTAVTNTAAGRDNDERNYYGLHWRKELNWRALCFEFVEDGDYDHHHEYEHGYGYGYRDEKVAFHA